MISHAGRTFSDQVLDGLDFSHRAWLDVTFVRCSIRRATFEYSDLSYVKFEECDLYETTFRGAVLYFCRFLECDATKADFSDALLNGIRVQDTDITQVEFGSELRVGKNRKSLDLNQLSGTLLYVTSGDLIPEIGELESSYEGLVSAEVGRAIQFIQDPAEEGWRKWRRRSEVAKTVQRLLVENGYKDKSLATYYLFRYYGTRADPNTLRKWLRLLVFEWVWGYGVKVVRPILAWAIVTLLFAALYSLLPYWRPARGLAISDSPLLVVADGNVCWRDLSHIVLFSFQQSSLSAATDLKPVGMITQAATLFQQLFALLMTGLGIATITRRISSV